MATLRIKFLATTVQMQMHLDVFLPEALFSGPSARTADKLKVLWLLHPEGGDSSDWIRLSSVEHYAQAANIALVMPSLDNSMYMDMAHGAYPYFTYLTQELPRHARDLVQVLSPRREDNFVAGISTGGYGAVKWILRDPQMFSAAACLSGEIDMVAALRSKEEKDGLTEDWVAAFDSADRIAGTSDDLLHLCSQRTQRLEPAPSIHISGNARDGTLSRNRGVLPVLGQAGFNILFHEEADTHGWPFWDERIRHFIETAVAPAQ